MTHRLCMHQAGCGDFLSLRSPGVRILIDTGPRKYANELAAQLNRQQADLLVITHLDDDHFGGLRRLLERHPAADGPKQIWLNHFESTEALSNLIRGVEGRPIELNDHAMLEELGQSILDAAIEAGSGWASDTALEVIGADSHFDGPASVDAVVELDERAFAYVAAVAAPTLPEPWEEEDWADVEVSDEVRRLARALVFPPGYRRFREYWRSLSDTERARLRFRYYRAFAEMFHHDARGQVFIPHGDRWIEYRRSTSGRLRVTLNPNGSLPGSSELSQMLEEGQRIALPEPLGGLVHHALRGVAHLNALADFPKTLRLVDAIRQAWPNTRICENVGSPGSATTSDFKVGGFGLRVLGPDQKERQLLRSHWNRVREKGRVHLGRDHIAFLEASVHRAFTDSYSADSSVTNRSSIQLLVEGPNRFAVLTGDGRPETLLRGLQSGGLPKAKRCRVFKAAHHGSDHNIRIDELDNAVLTALEPKIIWVSGKGEHHPSEKFLLYLAGQRARHKFAIKLTNGNKALQRTGANYADTVEKGTFAYL